MVSYSDIQGGYAGEGNINSDPCFVSGPLGNYYLGQTAAGQPIDSNCVNTGSDTAINLGMDKFTTRIDGIRDKGVVDMGYHYPTGSADIDENWYVDWSDFVFLAGYWLQLCSPSDSNCLFSDITRDMYVDTNDLEELTYCWLDCYVTAATSPNPTDNSTGVDPNNALLNWSAGDGALFHNVYFGGDFNDVNIATPDSNEYMGQQTSTTWDPNSYDSNGLAPGTIYYWRIDQAGPRCTAKGPLWSFKTWAEPNLIAWWKLDDGSGSTAADSAGFNHGTLNGDPNWTIGQINGALDFDGDGDYVNVADIGGSLDIDNNITIATWVRLNNLDTYYFIATKQPSGTARDYYPGNYGLRLQPTTGYLELTHQTSTAETYSVYTSTSGVATGAWHHVAATLTEGANVNFYIDGSPAGTSSQSGAFGIFNDEPVRIGTRKDAYSWFDGKIDDVRIYDRALNSGDVLQLYNDGL